MCLNPSSITQSSLFLPTVKGILSSSARAPFPTRNFLAADGRTLAAEA